MTKTFATTIQTIMEETPEWKRLNPHGEDLEAHLLHVFSENMKYFASPLGNSIQPTAGGNGVKSFPTPYSRVQSSADNSCASNAEVAVANGRNGNAGSSPFLDNSILPMNTTMTTALGEGSATKQLQHGAEPSLDDINLQPSSVFNNALNQQPSVRISGPPGNNVRSQGNGHGMLIDPNSAGPQNGNCEFLASPEQLREFLLDSPNFSLLNNNNTKTPAKTPLKFLNSSAQINWDLLNSTSSTKFLYSNSNRTPLRRIDQNVLTFNNMPSSVSPYREKKDALNFFGTNSTGLTPFAKREIGNDFDPSNIQTSNSALADFQRARKDTMGLSLNSTPNVASIRKNKNSFLMKTPNNNKSPSKLSKLGNIPNFTNRDDENKENNIYGSSPTTIQLNSSVTKSPLKIDHSRLNIIPSQEQKNLPAKNRQLKAGKQSDYNIDDRLLLFDRDSGVLKHDDEDSKLAIPLSPTPISHNKSNIALDAKNRPILPIPELPKMGSFKSDSMATAPKVFNTVPNNSQKAMKSKSKDGKVKKKIKKQPKFQIIVSNAHKFNVTKSSTTLQSGAKGPTNSKKANLQRSASTLTTNQKPKKNGLPKSKSFSAAPIQNKKQP